MFRVCRVEEGNDAMASALRVLGNRRGLLELRAQGLDPEALNPKP